MTDSTPATNYILAAYMAGATLERHAEANATLAATFRRVFIR